MSDSRRRGGKRPFECRTEGESEGQFVVTRFEYRVNAESEEEAVQETAEELADLHATNVDTDDIRCHYEFTVNLVLGAGKRKDLFATE